MLCGPVLLHLNKYVQQISPIRIVRPLWIISIRRHKKMSRKSRQEQEQEKPKALAIWLLSPVSRFWILWHFILAQLQTHGKPQALCHFSRCLGVWPRQNNISALGNRRESNKQQIQRQRMHSEKISINSAEHMVLFKLFLSAKEMIKHQFMFTIPIRKVLILNQ